MSNSIYSSGAGDYTYISGVNDSCIAFTMEPECPDRAKLDGNGNLILPDADAQGNPIPGTGTPNTGIQSFVGLIAQQITCSCARQPTIVYEIGTKNYYAIDAKPQGQGRLQNILGPTKESIQSLRTLGDICNPTRITITIKPCSCFCEDNGTSSSPSKLRDRESLIFTGGFLTNVTLSASSKDLVVQGSWDFLFQDLQKLGKN